MDWTMLGAVGEILGAGGVILTLWYLASQVRQSTAASRQEAVRELMDQSAATLAWISESPRRSRLWVRGTAGDRSLSPEELGQFRAFLFQLVMVWQRLYHLDRASARVDPWFVTTISTVRAEIAGSPGFRAWFEARGHWIDPGFRAVLEREMRGSPGYEPLGLGEDQLELLGAQSPDAREDAHGGAGGEAAAASTTRAVEPPER